MIYDIVLESYYRHNTIHYNEDVPKRLDVFDTPIVAYAKADDKLFKNLVENKDIVQGVFMPPEYWLSSAKTVVSIFFPYSKTVKESNINGKMPSIEWLYGRYEGQDVINKIARNVVAVLSSKGYGIACPSIDSRYRSLVGTRAPNIEKPTNKDYYSNWSERHVAHICGLGTFGLSRGLITSKGMAGRFTSFVVDIEYPSTHKNYSGIYDYCIECGECIDRCPVKAIDMNGKKHTPCSRYLDYTLKIFNPRYGCGKCQVGVPCESTNPCIG